MTAEKQECQCLRHILLCRRCIRLMMQMRQVYDPAWQRHHPQDDSHMIHALPVHSQSRGKIFLPFIDEDPKTAEIMSKILLFAQDDRIKDPYIMDQILRE